SCHVSLRLSRTFLVRSGLLLEALKVRLASLFQLTSFLGERLKLPKALTQTFGLAIRLGNLRLSSLRVEVVVFGLLGRLRGLLDGLFLDSLFLLVHFFHRE